MAEFPALPIFTDALIADTQHLSDEELGAYFRLLMLTWRNAGCRLPADATWHMRRLAIDENKYNTLYAPLISEFFQTDGNFIFQKRLMKEFKYLRDHSAKQSARAKSRWNKKKDISRGSTASGNAPTPTPTPTPNSDSDTIVSSSPPKPPKVSLDELSVDHIRDWLAEKRAQGRYLKHEEHFVLEQFKTYCQSKGKRYADYVAGYRNAFEWERCQPKPDAPRKQTPFDRLVAGAHRATPVRSEG